MCCTKERHPPPLSSTPRIDISGMTWSPSSIASASVRSSCMVLGQPDRLGLMMLHFARFARLPMHQGKEAPTPGRDSAPSPGPEQWSQKQRFRSEVGFGPSKIGCKSRQSKTMTRLRMTRLACRGMPAAEIPENTSLIESQTRCLHSLDNLVSVRVVLSAGPFTFDGHIG